ncbi:MAG: NAD(P)H-hydrate dehydratase [Spirochaetales bacterium]|nr:NAD(P)H-hydrate dehydratase [Spirochaetales bacterium]
MKPLVCFAEAVALDASTKERFGLSDDQLMESAAAGMVSAIMADNECVMAMENATVPAVAVCGRGNNAGDALAVLRRLAFAGLNGLVAIVPESPGPVAARRLAEARLAGVVVLDPDDQLVEGVLASAALVLDGISGIGYRGPRRPAAAALMALMERARGRVMAIDVPSGTGPWASLEGAPEGAQGQSLGVDVESPVSASATLCVEPLKAELYYPGYRPYAGTIVSITGVMPRSAGVGSNCSLLEESDFGSLLPRLDPDAHKGSRGALCVFAGSAGASGAAVLCARAASAGGAGSVTLLTEEGLVAVLQGLLTAHMVRPAHDPGSRRFNAAVAGPGWGLGVANERALEDLYAADIPLLLDADALRLLVRSSLATRNAPLVLTPHPGEFAPLLAVAEGAMADEPEAIFRAKRRLAFDTAAAVADVARRYGAVVVLKGSTTWIADPEGRLAVWDGRDPGLATAGSGDVLAGVAGAYLARGASAWDAAVAAVIAHALAGRVARGAGFYEAGALIEPLASVSYGRSTGGNQG